MSDSESASSKPLPSPTRLEDALRNVVERHHQSGSLDELTVKRVRKDAESDLSIEEGFFRRSEWKDKSKRIIEDEYEVQAAQTPCRKPLPLDQIPPQKAINGDAKPRDLQPSQPKNSLIFDFKPRKRRKRADISESDEELVDRETSEALIDLPRKSKEKRRPQPSSVDAAKIDTQNAKLDCNNVIGPTSKPNHSISEDSDSMMSEVIDDGPISKPRRKRVGHSAIRPGSQSPLSEVMDDKLSKRKKPRKPEKRDSKGNRQSKKTTDRETDPDVEEVKRLQGWLVKCGIRKMWYRELAPYDTAKAKIHHLKQMLSNAGMTGRYSIEKAAQIRDTRELQTDLADIQAASKKWGKEDSDEEVGTKPRRRLAKGLRNLDFLGDDGGEETD